MVSKIFFPPMNHGYDKDESLPQGVTQVYRFLFFLSFSDYYATLSLVMGSHKACSNSSELLKEASMK